MSDTNLVVHANCLMFFMDETGNEEFADTAYPVFGIGGCAIMARDARRVIEEPWEAMKAEHFDGVETLHAADLRTPSSSQLEALGSFFRRRRFGRFAAMVNSRTALPQDTEAIQLVSATVKQRWQKMLEKFVGPIEEVALIHEASDRGNKLIKKFFGETIVQINGDRIPVHHAFMPKSAKSAPLEVADFIMHAAGRHVRNRSSGKPSFGLDFKTVFHSHPYWSSFFDIDSCHLND